MNLPVASSFSLPEFLVPSECHDLVRLGRSFDGGYVVSTRSMAATDTLLSLGVNDDWSFEQAFCERRKVELTCVDGSVSEHRFGTEARVELARAAFALARAKTANAKAALGESRRLWALHNKLNAFFDGRSRRLISDYVGPEEWGRLSWTSLSRWTSDRTFIKVDIEGGEYRLLRDLAADAHRLTGLVVEFHDADLLLPELRTISDALHESMAIVHIHANNCSAPIRGAVVPPVLEVTWTSRTLLTAEEQQLSIAPQSLPRVGLDYPNDPRQPDIQFSW